MEVIRILAESYGESISPRCDMDSILKKEASLQTYLNASLYNAVRSSSKNVAVSKKKLPVKTKLQI